MCTAITVLGLAGRTLDLEFSFAEEIVISPMGYDREYLHLGSIKSKNALLGVAHIEYGVPLYYDAMSSTGLYMAALNFPQYAVYKEKTPGKINLASAELIPYLLGECRTLSDAEVLLGEINITPDGIFGMPPTELHWFLTDGKRALVIEPNTEGLIVTENPHKTLTNAPNIEYHLTKMGEFSRISPTNPLISTQNERKFPIYSRGMGGVGLPGDFSSSSRFVRASFLAENLREMGTIFPQNKQKIAENDNIFSQISGKSHQNSKKTTQNSKIEPNDSTEAKISAFFHLTDSLAVPYGSVLTDEGRAVYTVYTSCADLTGGVLYVTTYACRTPHAVALTHARKSSSGLLRFPLAERESTVEL